MYVLDYEAVIGKEAGWPDKEIYKLSVPFQPTYTLCIMILVLSQGRVANLSSKVV